MHQLFLTELLLETHHLGDRGRSPLQLHLLENLILSKQEGSYFCFLSKVFLFRDYRITITTKIFFLSREIKVMETKGRIEDECRDIFSPELQMGLS
jgi:hypothetical protein